MPNITFTDSKGAERQVFAQLGLSVMEAAKRGGVEEIEAECGGGCACATCHVIVASEWFEVTGPPSEDEKEMLEFTFEREATSRLSCQIRLTEALDGLKVRTPARQT